MGRRKRWNRWGRWGGWKFKKKKKRGGVENGGVFGRANRIWFKY